MEEFLINDHPFFVTPGNSGKYFYHVVSTFRQDSYLLLDTIKINSLMEKLFYKGLIDEFAGFENLRREVSVERSKFDFLVERKNKKPALVEIKSCSLCHKGVAMFPDAPTTRGKRHLEDLELLGQSGYDCYTLYLITHSHAEKFSPNGHTDPDYCHTFNKSKNVGFLAYSIHFIDPVTADISRLKKSPSITPGRNKWTGTKEAT